MTTEELFSKLPDKIILPNPHPIDELDDERWYLFELNKYGDEYELSYYDFANDEELISFQGSLPDIASKMYDWCKENHYLRITDK